MNIVAIYGVDAESNNLFCIFWARTGRSCKDGNINVFQLCDVIYHLIICQFCWFILSTLATYDTCNLEIWSCFESLYCKLTDVAVTYLKYVTF